MCGHEFDRPAARPWRIPVADIFLVLGILAVLLFWGRWEGVQQVLALTPTATATATTTPTPHPTATPTPSPTPSPTATLTPTPTFYTVKSGDTLLTIAGEYGITLEELKAANNWGPDSILRPQQVLLIPPPAPPAAQLTPVPDAEPAANATPTPEGGLANYQVQKGDTINSIAMRFGIGLSEILDQNPNIGDPNDLKPGMVLIIPLGQLSATPTPNVSGAPQDYPPPILVSPVNASELSSAASPLLRWVSLGALPRNVWYEVQLAYLDTRLPAIDAIRTRSTSVRLDPALRPAEDAASAEITWWVRVVRLLPDGSVQAISSPSEVRVLIWR